MQARLTDRSRRRRLKRTVPEELDRSVSDNPDHLDRAHVFVRTHAAVRADRHVLNGHHRQHDHSFFEIAFVLGGHGVHRTVHGEHRLQRGDTIVLRPGVWHAYLACEQLEVLNCYVGEDVLHRELAWALDDPLLGRLFWTLPRSLDRAGAIVTALDAAPFRAARIHLETLEAMCTAPSPPERAELLGHLLLLLGRLAHCIATPRTPTSSASVPTAVLGCIQRLEADPARPWTLAELARDAGVTGAHLSRLFKRAAGLPPLAYLTRWRLERAAALLVQTPHPVADIAAEVGWLDANLFSRRFRAHFGESPSAYRARQGGAAFTRAAVIWEGQPRGRFAMLQVD
jgi:AraC family L-rhamnose operon transcriptional activator RhaR